MLQRNTLYIALLLILSSCFEIVEDITFKNDGSGNLKVICNLSQSKSELNTLIRMDSSSGYRIPSKLEIDEHLDLTLKVLKSTEGLSNVTLKRDYTNWIFEIQAEFKSVKYLEEGLKKINDEFVGDRSYFQADALVYDGKSLVRDVKVPDEETRKYLNKPTEKRILSLAKYTTIYHFERPIVSCTNKNAKISPSRKAIMLQSNLINLINGEESIKNLIKLK